MKRSFCGNGMESSQRLSVSIRLPLAAHAQQPTMPVIGFLSSGARALRSLGPGRAVSDADGSRPYSR
jgi:hypothetical protein